jgi:carbonic anhydrase
MESLDLSQFYAYDGSLTTPPCWEGIRWTVLANALPIGKNVMNLIKRNYS